MNIYRMAVPEALKDARTCHLEDTLQHMDEAGFHKEASYAAKSIKAMMIEI